MTWSTADTSRLHLTRDGRGSALMRALVIGAAVIVYIGAAAALWRPEWFARRLVGGILPASAERDFARELVRNAAVWAIGAGVLLAILWRLSGALGDAAFRHWCLWTAAGLLAAMSLAFWWYVDDDAGISFAYARNLAGGLGLVYQPGDPPVEGYSNPLWVLMLAAAGFVGADLVGAAKVLGLVLGIAGLMVMARTLRGQHPLVFAALPLTAANAATVIWNGSGLENALHAFLLIALVHVLADPQRRRHNQVTLLGILSLLALSRPEGILFAGATGAWFATCSWRGRDPVRPAILSVAVPAAVLAGLTVFRYLYFGDVLPNTFYAKAGGSNPLRLLNPLSGGWAYVFGAAQGCGWTIAAVPLLLLLATYRTWPSIVPACLVVIAAQLFFVVSVGGDWMLEFRFITPIVPMVSILIGLSLARLAQLLQHALGWTGKGVVLCLIPALLIIGSQVPRLIVFAHDPTTPMKTVGEIGRYFVQLARRGGINEPTLLAHDAGGTAYLAGIHLIDLGGLCDRTIAKHRYDRELLRRYIFEEKRPTFIYSAKVFADRIRLEEFPEFRADYVRLPPAPRPELDGYVRHVRRDVYPLIFRHDGRREGKVRE